MKYENPIMSVSLFDAENVATTGSVVPAPTTAMDEAEAAALAAVGGAGNEGKVIAVTF